MINRDRLGRFASKKYIISTLITVAFIGSFVAYGVNYNRVEFARAEIDTAMAQTSELYQAIKHEEQMTLNKIEAKLTFDKARVALNEAMDAESKATDVRFKLLLEIGSK